MYAVNAKNLNYFEEMLFGGKFDKKKVLEFTKNATIANYQESSSEHPSHGAHALLEELEELIGGVTFGIGSCYPEKPEWYFLDMGDAYTNTILYNYNTDRFYIGCWGDLFE